MLMPTTTATPVVVGMEHVVGKRGWREYRYTSGTVRWAIDREWVKDRSGQWRKRGHHRRDLPPMTEEQYERWKAVRADARSNSRRSTRRPLTLIRELVVE